MKIIWKGTLTRGGRAPMPFEAELVDDNGTPVLIERQGIEVTKSNIHDIRAESLIAALAAEAAKNSSAPPPA